MADDKNFALNQARTELYDWILEIGDRLDRLEGKRSQEFALNQARTELYDWILEIGDRLDRLEGKQSQEKLTPQEKARLDALESKIQKALEADPTISRG